MRPVGKGLLQPSPGFPALKEELANPVVIPETLMSKYSELEAAVAVPHPWIDLVVQPQIRPPPHNSAFPRTFTHPSQSRGRKGQAAIGRMKETCESGNMVPASLKPRA